MHAARLTSALMSNSCQIRLRSSNCCKPGILASVITHHFGPIRPLYQPSFTCWLMPPIANLDQMLPKRSCARFSPHRYPAMGLPICGICFSWCSLEPSGFVVQHLSTLLTECNAPQSAVPVSTSRPKLSRCCSPRPNRLMGRRG